MGQAHFLARRTCRVNWNGRRVYVCMYGPAHLLDSSFEPNGTVPVLSTSNKSNDSKDSFEFPFCATGIF